MVGIVMVSHGEMAKYMLESAELIVGSQENVAAVCLRPEDSPESFSDRLVEAIDSLNIEDGLLILGDVCGGTPWNCSAVLSQERPLEILVGTNLPMLLEIFMNRPSCSSVEELVEIGETSGKAGITTLSCMLAQVD